jgi:hypothetical protein
MSAFDPKRTLPKRIDRRDRRIDSRFSRFPMLSSVARFLCDIAARWTMEKGGVAVGLATISVVGAAFLFSAEHVRTGPMNFIERYLNISLDGGDGSMEILVLVVLVAIVVAGALRLATK